MSLGPPLTGIASPLPLPNTAPTPATGEPVRAEDVQTGVQALLNQDATLEAALPRNALVGWDVIEIGGSALENLTVTGSGAPTYVINSTTLHGTPSGFVVISGINVAVGDVIDASAVFDYIMAVHAADAAAVMFATIGVASPVKIPGAVFYMPADTARHRLSVDGRLIAPTAGALIVKLYIFMGGSDTWQHMGTGSVRSRVAKL